MTCEECRQRMPEFWEDTLAGEERAALETHLASCSLCRSEAERLNTIWQALERLPAAQPDRGMRTRFYEGLEAYRQGFEESHSGRDRAGRPANSPVWQIAAAAAVAALAFISGFWIDNRRDTVQVSQLRNEVVNMRQLVTLSLLQQQNATDRLKGVNWAYRTEQPDTEVLAALLYTVNHDSNINVRLAAVDALRTYADSPVARRGLTQAIGKQQSPMVQIALIDQLAELRDEKAVSAIQVVANDSRTDAEVRQRAEWALRKLQ